MMKLIWEGSESPQVRIGAGYGMVPSCLSTSHNLYEWSACSPMFRSLIGIDMPKKCMEIYFQMKILTCTAEPLYNTIFFFKILTKDIP